MKPVQVAANVRVGIQMYGDLSDSNIYFFREIYIEYLFCAWHFVGPEDKVMNKINFLSSWDLPLGEGIRKELTSFFSLLFFFFLSGSIIDL